MPIFVLLRTLEFYFTVRDRSRTAATSKMEPFVIIVNGWKPLTVTTKISILDVAAALNPPLTMLLPFFPVSILNSIVPWVLVLIKLQNYLHCTKPEATPIVIFEN